MTLQTRGFYICAGDGSVVTTSERAEAVADTNPAVTASPLSAAREVGAVFTQAGVLGRERRRLAVKFARIARGSTSITPDSKEWRFQDPAWSEHPVYRRLAQS
jgi:polyhydroxyalkanoate synthase